VLLLKTLSSKKSLTVLKLNVCHTHCADNASFYIIFYYVHVRHVVQTAEVALTNSSLLGHETTDEYHIQLIAGVIYKRSTDSC
jgi:hypothetical protein